MVGQVRGADDSPAFEGSFDEHRQQFAQFVVGHGGDPFRSGATAHALKRRLGQARGARRLVFALYHENDVLLEDLLVTRHIDRAVFIAA
jgi:hypothetical protein